MSKQQEVARRKPLGNYGLSIVLGLLFLVSWLGQFLVQLRSFTDQQEQHGQAFSWGQFWPEFWQSTLENWQSEFLQLLSFVVLSAYLIHRGSAESKDADDEVQAALERIEARLDRMEREGRGDGARAR